MMGLVDNDKNIVIYFLYINIYALPIRIAANCTYLQLLFFLCQHTRDFKWSTFLSNAFKKCSLKFIKRNFDVLTYLVIHIIYFKINHNNNNYNNN